MICRKVSIWIHQVTIWTPLGKHGVQFFWLLSGPFLRTFEVNYIFVLQPLIVLFVASGKLCLSSAALVFSDTDLVGTEEHLQGEQTRPRRESFRESKGTAIQDMQLTMREYM